MAPILQATTITTATPAATATATAISAFPQNFIHFPSKPTTLPPKPPPSSLHLLHQRHRRRHSSPPFCTSADQSLLSPQPSLSKTQNPKPVFPVKPLEDPPCCDSLIDVDELLNLLRLSVKDADFELARAVHASILKLQEDIRLGNSVITAYLKLGLVPDAYRAFLDLSSPDVVSYTALISSFAKVGLEDEAVELFFEMRMAGIEPNEYSFVAILTACIRILDLELGLQVHCLAMKMGFSECVFVTNALMGLYGKCGWLDVVIRLFDDMPQRDVASWNTMLSSVSKELSHEKALEMFRVLQGSKGCKVDQFTLSTILTACTKCHAVMEGRQVHAHAVRIGLEGNLSVNNALIGFYTKCGNLKDVDALFERMPERDVLTWTEMITAYMEFGLVDLALEKFKKMPQRNSVSFNALLAGFCQNNEGSKALELFIGMVQEGIELTDFTLTSAINACGLLAKFELSRQIHGFAVKFGLGSNACIEAALLDMCTRCGRMKDAEKMFYSWSFDQDWSIIQTSMLCGYARNGLPDEAISLFHRSLSEGTMVMDEVALTAILGVCGTLGFHEMGKQIHCQAHKTGFSVDIRVGNSLISMYSKCCNMDDSLKSFNLMPTYDIVSWNGMIAGHLLHRQGDEALAVWSRMGKAHVKPDAITFVLVVSAYKHTISNMVENCRSLFRSMKTVYGVERTSEHYASMVSVLGYWGLLEEAEKLILEMPFQPDASVWRALLDSCRLHSNTSIGKRVAKHILAMQPQDPSTYVLVSNLYSASGRWHCSEMVRDDMRKRGLRKHPCRSWIIHDKKVHSFYARDRSHPQEKDIHSALEILILECLRAGYEPDTSYVLHEVEEQQKKNFLFNHSAKLAATYGLLTAKPGQPIQIFKNILLCGDCHTFLKYASAVTRKEISLRDTSGFHFFSNGQCSCKDYW